MSVRPNALAYYITVVVKAIGDENRYCENLVKCNKYIAISV